MANPLHGEASLQPVSVKAAENALLPLQDMTRILGAALWEVKQKESLAPVPPPPRHLTVEPWAPPYHSLRFLPSSMSTEMRMYTMRAMMITRNRSTSALTTSTIAPMDMKIERR